mmetsp:Transcript_20463/g.36131  ORF Transcript_20463/g.36131 Transcript_20463/m.36131 type:complete len:354 (+) Transcript_20463:134-1195(+)
MPEFGASLSRSLSRPKLDTTIIIDNEGEDEKGQCSLFALVSLNASTAPSIEVPWSQLLALSLSPDKDPPVLTVGRHKDCKVQLSDPRVSLHHFEIVARRRCSPTDTTCESLTYECHLNDLSSNGTAVNGKTVGKNLSERLRSGDEICVLPTHKVGQDKRIAFIFRNTTEILGTPKEVKQLELDELVLCPICMQAIYKCVALMPCFHNFCMACYSEWMNRKDNCPVCRQKVTAVMKNHAMDGVVEAFLEAYPERRRSKEELEDMDARDRLRLCAGGKVVRDHCEVGIWGAARAAGSVASTNATVAPPASGRGASSSAPASLPSTIPERRPTESSSPGNREATTPRIGTQVCVVQ